MEYEDEIMRARSGPADSSSPLSPSLRHLSVLCLKRGSTKGFSSVDSSLFDSNESVWSVLLSAIPSPMISQVATSANTDTRFSVSKL